MKNFLKLLPFILLSLVFLQRTAWGSDVFSYEGLLIPCENCVVNEDGTCEIVRGAASVLLPCVEAGAELIESMDEGAGGRVDLLLGVVRFLEKQKRPIHISTPFLRYLFKSADLSLVNRQTLESIIREYSAPLTTMIFDGTLSLKERPEVAQLMWSTQFGDRQEMLQLKAAVAVSSENFTVENFLSELSNSDLKADVADLRVIEQSLASTEKKLRAEIVFLRELLEECFASELDIGSTEKISEKCGSKGIDILATPLRNYIFRLQAQLVSRNLNKLTPSERQLPIVLSYISKTNFQQFRTPVMHEMLALVLGATKAEVEAKELDRESVKGTLQQYASVLASFAESDEDVRARLGELRELVDPQGREVAWKEIVLIGFLLAAIFGGFILVALRRRRDHDTEEQSRSSSSPNSLSLIETQTLKENLNFFGLGLHSEEQSLVRAFRSRVRLVHPDCANGDVEAFNEVAARYQEARSLMSKLR